MSLFEDCDEFFGKLGGGNRARYKLASCRNLKLKLKDPTSLLSGVSEEVYAEGPLSCNGVCLWHSV